MREKTTRMRLVVLLDIKKGEKQTTYAVAFRFSNLAGYELLGQFLLIIGEANQSSKAVFLTLRYLVYIAMIVSPSQMVYWVLLGVELASIFPILTITSSSWTDCKDHFPTNHKGQATKQFLFF